MQMPLIKVVAPSTPYDVKGLLKSAIRDDNPVVFLNQLSLGGKRGEVPDEEYLIPLCEGEIKRSGSDVTVCCAGLMLHRVLDAAEQLESVGIDVEVIDLRTLSPWDEELVLQSVAKTRRFVAVDESYPTCGAASEWAAMVAERASGELRSPVRRVSSRPVPIPFSPVLEKAVIPSADQIVAAVRQTM